MAIYQAPLPTRGRVWIAALVLSNLMFAFLWLSGTALHGSPAHVAAQAANGESLADAKRKAAARGDDGPAAANLPEPRSFFSLPKAARPVPWLEEKGWERASSRDKAIIVWTPRKDTPWSKLKRHHIPNHVKHENQLSNKGDLLTSLVEAGYDHSLFLPESYRLWEPEELAQFDERVKGGITFPWLLKEPGRDKGAGIHPLTDAAELAGLRKELDRPEPKALIAQRYIADPILYDKRKFDLRIYWMIASLDPFIVLYRDGTMRVSLTEYKPAFSKKEDGKTSLAEHLTNAIVQKDNANYESLAEQSRKSFDVLKTLLEENFPEHPNPLDEVRCQVQSALIACIGSIKDMAVRDTLKVVDNAYSLLGADFMIDHKLKVWMSEVQSGPGLPMNTQAVREVMESMMSEMIDIVDEVRVKKERGKPVLPLSSARHFKPIVLEDKEMAPACPEALPRVTRKQALQRKGSGKKFT